MRTLDEINSDIINARREDADYKTVLIPLFEERHQLIKQNRDQWDDDNYSIDIDCPEHITHKATLFTFGHKYAGVWECKAEGEGISDACPHFDIEIEDTEDSEGVADKIYVCVRCGVAVEGDPIADARE